MHGQGGETEKGHEFIQEGNIARINFQDVMELKELTATNKNIWYVNQNGNIIDQSGLPVFPPGSVNDSLGDAMYYGQDEDDILPK